MAIFKLLTLLAGAAALGLSGYLTTLLGSTDMLDKVTQIPEEHMMTFHIVAAVVIVWLFVGLVMKVMSRLLLIALIVVAVAAEGTFLGMNLTGLIEMEPQSLQDQIKDKADDLMDGLEELKDKLDN